MAQKQPSNSDILKGIKEIRDMQISQGGRISTLEQWKIAEDAYRAALAKVKDEQEEQNYRGLRDTGLTRRNEIMKQVYTILGILTLILAAYAAGHGIHT